MNLKIYRLKNNVFCKEQCCICGKWFDADSYTIYECLFGYVCFYCIGRIKNQNEELKKKGKVEGRKIVK
jgi:hypothetical protein